MNISRHIIFCSILLLPGLFNTLLAQPGYKVDIQKPKPYEERVLKAEKTGDGKLKAHKRFFQNLTTHFNYFFNANTKLYEVLQRAKARHRDDYSTLLSFYNYSLKGTRGETMELDSIIYKSQTGLVMHDLRNDWTDELYLLWGVAYFLRNDLDSASKMFQFINYAYAEKEEDGYYIPVGTRKEGENALSIASKEEGGLFKRTTSRNNSFLWQIRTLTELGKFSEAAGLINTLRNDPNFPDRLDNGLEEVQSYWFYKQHLWDSSAIYLVRAAEDISNRKEKARWEFLAAQMFEKAGKIEEAKKYYAQSIPHTTDPVMEVYARLNLVRMNKTSGDDYIAQNIAELLKMAKRDKYEDYRDVIYYMAAQMEMERGNLAAAQELLLKGSKYNNGNLGSRNKAFLQIADLSFDQKKYELAASFYDSVQMADLKPEEIERINERKPILDKIVANEAIVDRQDSLQAIAAMPEAERNVYLTKLLKQLRKQQGLKDEPLTAGSGRSSAAPDLFTGNQTKGDWYFYNSTLKTQGQQQFKQVWGNRPNADNWRRAASLQQQMTAQNQAGNKGTGNAQDVPAGAALTMDALTGNLPLSPELLTKSNDSIKTALFTLGSVYLNEAGDYASAIQVLEEIRKRFPDFQKMDEVLFNLYYAYLKAGDRVKAAEIKSLLTRNYATSRFAAIAQTGVDPSAPKTISPEATKEYEAIYNMFIEGNFVQAEAAKRRADSVYQTNYWQPQLLYIQSVYHIQQRNDSVAKTILQTLVTQEPNSALGKKAQNLINVLARRSQIENELANYQIQNQAETPSVTQPVTPPVTQPSVVQAPVQQPAIQQPAVQPPPVKKDTAAVVTTPVQKPADTTATAAKPVQKPLDTLATKPVQKPAEPVVTKPTPPPAQQMTAFGFTHLPETRHYALVVLNKVDPVFVNEARNAFARYNREKYNTQPLDVQINDITNEIRLLIISNFSSAQNAVDYVKQAKQFSASEIVPWLKGDKYTFSVITPANLELLKSTKNWDNYKKFTDQFMSGKF